MAFQRSSQTDDLVRSFAPNFKPGMRENFEAPAVDLNAGTKVDFGNYFGIGDLGGKLAASYENSFDPSSVAMNSAKNRSDIQNLVTGNQADMDALGLDAYATKQVNDKIRADKIKMAKERAKARNKSSTIGLFATLAGTAASFIPGVGPFIAPAVSTGVNKVGNEVS
tara:strand:- start:249 stop:749 length:501 start_codon:yes stop_codon:yes gene_type:complete